MTSLYKLNKGSGKTPKSIHNNKIDLLSKNVLHMPPQCVESEQIFIGSILKQGSLWSEYKSNTKAEAFYDSNHQEIIHAFHNMTQDDTPIDLMTLFEYFKRQGDEHQAGGSSCWTYLMELANSSYLPNLEHHHQEIMNAFRGRLLWEKYHRGLKYLGNSDYGALDGLSEEILELQYNASFNENKLIPISAKDLPNIEPPEPILEGLLYPSAITTITAAPGVGKTTFAYNIACYGALGSSFLGLVFPKHIKTLYVDLETPHWLKRTKIKSIFGECPEKFHFLDDINVKEDLAQLIQLCQQNSYDLIIFDTQSKALALEDENSNSEANQAAILLKRLVNQTRVALLLIHHTKKGIEGSKVYKGRGASAIAAAVDIVANLESVGPDTLKLTVAKSRIPGTFQSITMKKLGGDKFELVSTDAGKELEILKEVIIELNMNGLKANQKAVLEQLEGKLGEKRIRTLLKQGVGKQWELERGERNENVYTAIDIGN